MIKFFPDLSKSAYRGRSMVAGFGTDLSNFSKATSKHIKDFRINKQMTINASAAKLN